MTLSHAQHDLLSDLYWGRQVRYMKIVPDGAPSKTRTGWWVQGRLSAAPSVWSRERAVTVSSLEKRGLINLQRLDHVGCTIAFLSAKGVEFVCRAYGHRAEGVSVVSVSSFEASLEGSCCLCGCPLTTSVEIEGWDAAGPLP